MNSKVFQEIIDSTMFNSHRPNMHNNSEKLNLVCFAYIFFALLVLDKFKL